ncbi:transmembrane protein, putative (macronuclear) [Tetrahymena thermophila SB210]|uniref:Transmembrane protein, putative n=1 Tax=Tetrahymena thermophila (strain SB210) TaxID=312017 RepID=W7X463_TETTS|nr:transmembrane protein, putative [Tetrahymena thermophila SB210]EWS72222.1 transmembrane protein, putative [Tetrahymena thermophila SB210]|eukprot:XP_012655265.1 transmembrane protein, putative [Tetrahymena thermophila SB210]
MKFNQIRLPYKRLLTNMIYHFLFRLMINLKQLQLITQIAIFIQMISLIKIYIQEIFYLIIVNLFILLFRIQLSITNISINIIKQQKIKHSMMIRSLMKLSKLKNKYNYLKIQILIM